MKTLNVEFTSTEFETLKKRKGPNLTWHSFILYSDMAYNVKRILNCKGVRK